MSAMDVNDIIGMQSETVMESTLESEIDALSKIITDTKDGSQKTDDDEEFKLDSDEISFSNSMQYESTDSKSDDNLAVKDILDSSGEIEKFISAGSEISLQEEPKEQSSDTDSTNKEPKNCELAQSETANQKDESNNIALIITDQQESQSQLKNESVSEIEKVLDNRIEENVNDSQEDMNTVRDTNKVSPKVAQETEVVLTETIDKIDDKNELNIEDTQSTAEQTEEIDTDDQLDIVHVPSLPENEENDIIAKPSKGDDAEKALGEDQTSKETEVQETLMEDKLSKESEIEETLTTNKLLTENEITETPTKVENNIVQQESLNVEINLSEKPLDSIESSNKNKEIQSVENTVEDQEEEIKKTEAEVSESTTEDSLLVQKISNNSPENDDLLANAKDDKVAPLETEKLETKSEQESMEVDEVTDVTEIDQQEETECSQIVDDVLHAEDVDSGIVAEKVTGVEKDYEKSIFKEEVTSQSNQIIENSEILIDDSILPEATAETTEEIEKVSITESSDYNDEKVKNQGIYSNADSLQAAEVVENVENLQNTESEDTFSESTQEQEIMENQDLILNKENVEHEIESSNFENNELENLNDNKNASEQLCSSESAFNEASKISNEKIKVEDNSMQENDNSFESENIDTKVENDTKIEDNLKSKEELTNDSVIPKRIETSEDLKVTLKLDEAGPLSKTNILTAVEAEEKVEEGVNESDDIKAAIQEEIIEDKVAPINEEEIEDQVEINFSLDPEGNSSPIIEDLHEEQKNPGSSALDELIDNTNVIVESRETMEAEEPDFSEILGINEKVEDTVICDQNLQKSATNDSNGVENNLDLNLNPLLDTEESIADSETLNPQDEIIESMEEQFHDPFATFDLAEQEATFEQKIDQVPEPTEVDENLISEQEIDQVSEPIEKQENLIFEQEIDEVSAEPAEKEEILALEKEINQVSKSAEKDENLASEQEINQASNVTEKNENLTSEQEIDQASKVAEKYENLTSEQEIDQVSKLAEKDENLTSEQKLSKFSKCIEKEGNLMLEESSQFPKHSQRGEIESDLNECYILENSEESNTDALEDLTKCNEPIFTSDQNDGAKEDTVDENVDENAKICLDL